MSASGDLSADIRRLSAAAAQRDRRGAPLTAAVREQGDRLLDALAGAGIASGATVTVGGVAYQFIVENESLSDSPAVRRSHAVLTAGGVPVVPGPADFETGRRFLHDQAAIAGGFAAQAAEALDHELFPKRSFLGRLEVACSEAGDRFFGTPGGRIVDEVVDDLAGAATDGLQPRAAETRPVRVAVRVLARAAGQLIHDDKMPLLALAGGGIAAATGVTPAIALAAVGLTAVKGGLGYLRAAGERRRLTAAARAQLSLRQRIDATKDLERLSAQRRVEPERTTRPRPGEAPRRVGAAAQAL